jgi:hypothetical protein
MMVAAQWPPRAAGGKRRGFGRPPALKCRVGSPDPAGNFVKTNIAKRRGQETPPYIPSVSFPAQKAGKTADGVLDGPDVSNRHQELPRLE